jgi:hypothetical protein
MINIKGIIVFAVLALQLLAPCVKAENVVSDKEALQGIQKIGVKIGEISLIAKKIGVDREYLRRKIGLQLRSAGITIVTLEELETNREIPYLLTTVLVSCSKSTYSYVVMIGFNEKVHLARDPKIIVYATPWWRIVKGEHFDKLEIVKEVDKTLIKLLNEFAKDYFAVNPNKTIE